MGAMVRFWVFALYFLAALAGLVRPARADWGVNLVLVQCDATHNRVLVRFGGMEDENPAIGGPVDLSYKYLTRAEIPESLAKSWSGIPTQNAGTCLLKNGQVISVSERNGYMSNTAGGGDPSAYFTMKIGDHALYNGLIFYRGYGSSTYTLSAITYDGQTLTECTTDETIGVVQLHDATHINCRNASNRLLPGHAFLTQDELAEYAKDQERAELQTALSPFCRSLKMPPNTNETFNVSGRDVATIDINNDGKPDTVFTLSVPYTINYYNDDMGYLVAFTTPSGDPDAFASATADVDNRPDPNMITATAKNDGGSVINLAPSNRIFTDHNKVYIFSYDPSPDNVPSSIISEMMPDNSIKQLCAFP